VVDAVRRMTSDHEALDDLLRRLAAAATTNGRGELAEEFTRRLRAHVAAADELVLPLLRERATGGDLEQLQRVLAVDARLSGELERLAGLAPGDANFDAQLERVRRELVEHADLESSLVLPRTEDLLDDQELIALGERIERREGARPGGSWRSRLPAQVSIPAGLVRAARTVGIIVAAGVVLAILGRRPRLRTSGPRPPRR
jgi:hypothetical protein